MGYPVVFATLPAGNQLAALFDQNFAFALAKDGSVTPTAGIPFFAGSVALPGIYFGAHTTTGIYEIGLNNIGLSIAGVKLVDISAGAVAITGTLAVTGAATISGLATFESALGISVGGPINIAGLSGGNIVFPATANLSANANVLDDYQEATFTVTLTGVTASVTGTASYTKIGNAVTIKWPFLTGTSNTTEKTVTGAPADCQPVTATYQHILAQNNGGGDTAAACIVAATGVLTLFPDSALNAWTAAGTCAMRPNSMAFTLA